MTGVQGKLIAIQTLTTNQGGVTTDEISLLSANEPYYLVETKTPNGYIGITEPIKVTVDMTGHNTWTKLDDGTTSQIKPSPYALSNWLQEATIKLWKMDDTPYDPAHVSIYDHINDTTSASVTYKIINNVGYELPSTGGSGNIVFYVLGITLTSFACVGVIYSIIEVTPPTGYVITNNTPITFKITGGSIAGEHHIEGVTYESDANDFTIPNKPGAALPNTGGLGTAALYIFGAALAGLACIGFVIVENTLRTREKG